MQRRSIADQIRDLDGQLLVSVDRLQKYLAQGNLQSVATQRRVIDRQLDKRLELMAVRG